ncbi:MAG TPA: transketolase [Candidatus Paceibacterota bacterium]|nr:transketolase [Candidatus Paceibacterota bacterium]
MEKLTDEKIKELKIIANDIRKSIIEMLLEAKSGHTAGSLGMVDIFTLLYFHSLRHDPKNPLWVNRDRLVLSNGHICPVLYATMAHSGYFPKAELLRLRKFGSRLQGHPHREYLPFVETSSGPLGSGLSQAVGMAIADKIYENTKTIYAILSDGEHDEGNTWEAIMLANKEKLSNLIVIVDRNNIQIGGNTERVMPLGDLKEKYKSFGWFAEEVDGHNFWEINNAIYKAKNHKGGPSVIIAHTIPGKGIKEWENDYKWHGKAPNRDEAEKALKELANKKI